MAKADSGKSKISCSNANASYLIAQNDDPHKEPIDFAQSYFAIQTANRNLIEDRMQSDMTRQRRGQPC